MRELLFICSTSINRNATPAVLASPAECLFLLKSLKQYNFIQMLKYVYYFHQIVNDATTWANMMG